MRTENSIGKTGIEKITVHSQTRYGSSCHMMEKSPCYRVEEPGGARASIVARKRWLELEYSVSSTFTANIAIFSNVHEQSTTTEATGRSSSYREYQQHLHPHTTLSSFDLTPSLPTRVSLVVAHTPPILTSGHPHDLLPLIL